MRPSSADLNYAESLIINSLCEWLVKSPPSARDLARGLLSSGWTPPGNPADTINFRKGFVVRGEWLYEYVRECNCGSTGLDHSIECGLELVGKIAGIVRAWSLAQHYLGSLLCISDYMKDLCDVFAGNEPQIRPSTDA